MTSAARATPAADRAEPDPRRWAILAILCLSMLLIITNSSSLNVALPTLSRDLDATASDLQWIVASYSLVFAGLLFSSGTLGDRFGRKGALQGGLVLFMAATLAASQATEAWHLIACRGVMGMAAALVMPSTLSILMGVFPTHERPKAIAFWAGVTGVAGTVGPLASGYLLEHYWFGAVFLINIPIGLAALVGGWLLVPRSKDPAGTPLDPMGAGLSIITITAFVYGLIAAPAAGWLSTATGVALLVTLAAGGTFAWWELRSTHPMLDIRLFRHRAFSTGTTGMIAAFLAMFGAAFLLTQYFQLVAGYSPLSTALRFLPTGVCLVLVSPMTPRLSRRFGANRVVGVGLLLIAASMASIMAVQVDSPYPYVLFCMMLLMVGLGLSLSPLTAAIMSSVPAERPGSASATNNSTRELGGALGVAILGSLAASRYASALGPEVAGLPAADQARATTSLTDAALVADQLTPGEGDSLMAAAQQAFVDGMHLAHAVPLALCLIGAILVWRCLPPQSAPTEPPLEHVGSSVELAAELGIGGAMPAFGDDPDDERSKEWR